MKTWRLILRPEAEEDLQSAVDWYEDRRAGLGREFTTCIEAALALMLAQPSLGSLVFRDVRRHLVRRFPYAVFYVVAVDTVVVVAILHQRRDPLTVTRR